MPGSSLRLAYSPAESVSPTSRHEHTARFIAFVLCVVASARADLDLDSNGLGDVWEAKYKPATLVASQDNDADGRTNLEECEAGTDPLSAEDIFAVSEIRVAGNDLLLTWPSQAGKRYQSQSTTTPGTSSCWLAIPGIHFRNRREYRGHHPATRRWHRLLPGSSPPMSIRTATG